MYASPDPCSTSSVPSDRDERNGEEKKKKKKKEGILKNVLLHDPYIRQLVVSHNNDPRWSRWSIDGVARPLSLPPSPIFHDLHLYKTQNRDQRDEARKRKTKNSGRVAARLAVVIHAMPCQLALVTMRTLFDLPWVKQTDPWDNVVRDLPWTRPGKERN